MCVGYEYKHTALKYRHVGVYVYIYFTALI